MTNPTIKEISTTPGSLALPYLVKAPQAKEANKKALILLHGVGSNEADLFSLASQLPPDFYVVSPRGPFTLGAGRYAWYGVDFSTGGPVYNAEQEAFSRDLLRTFIRQVKSTYGVEDVYLGGFSQGAIMSYSIGLTHPAEVQGIIALSGRILEELKPLVKKEEYLRELSVFVAHGLQDNTLSIHYAKQAKAYLETLGVSLSYHEYPIGHQITGEVLQDLNNWLR